MRPALAPYLSCKICVFATHLKLSLITLSVARLRAVLYLLHLLHLLCAFEGLPKKVTETQGMGIGSEAQRAERSRFCFSNQLISQSANQPIS